MSNTISTANEPDTMNTVNEPKTWNGFNPSRQCRLVLGDPERGYMRLCSQARGFYPYHDKLTINALNAQYRRAYPSDKYPQKLGAGTWIKTVRDAGKSSADRWIGVGLWATVFRTFQLELQANDIEWKPDNRSGVTCYDSLDREDVAQQGRNITNKVRVLSTFIRDWNFLHATFREAASKSAEIEVLLLDYDSPQVQYRADGLGMRKEKMQSEIYRSLETLADFYGELSGKKVNAGPAANVRFEVRLFDAAPVASLYWFDDVCYMGIHWLRQHSTETPQLRIEKEKNSALYLSMEMHFETMWAEAGGKRIHFSGEGWRLADETR